MDANPPSYGVSQPTSERTSNSSSQSEEKIGDCIEGRTWEEASVLVSQTQGRGREQRKRGRKLTSLVEPSLFQRNDIRNNDTSDDSHSSSSHTSKRSSCDELVPGRFDRKREAMMVSSTLLPPLLLSLNVLSSKRTSTEPNHSR